MVPFHSVKRPWPAEACTGLVRWLVSLMHLAAAVNSSCSTFSAESTSPRCRFALATDLSIARMSPDSSVLTSKSCTPSALHHDGALWTPFLGVVSPSDRSNLRPVRRKKPAACEPLQLPLSLHQQLRPVLHSRWKTKCCPRKFGPTGGSPVPTNRRTRTCGKNEVHKKLQGGRPCTII